MGDRFLHIAGNHDTVNRIGEPPQGYTRLPDGLALTMPDGKKYLISHGHLNDPSMGSVVSKIGVDFVGFLERKIDPNIDITLDKIAQALLSTTDSDIVQMTHKFAAAHLKAGYDKVCCGHTHFVGKDPKLEYYNSGTCTHRRFEGLIIHQDGKITIVN
eukprot:NODE_2212_length_817_cov_131.726562_g1548_i0.p1 GENE.NODE_2212_length_817_cov_131.726562_g1548_i0~~NODE_2212_length_817_cov_131.726562_g1548_i0.p1  ORF type:complete len:167 (+),score=50.37 NODE_2212_length_817_cov_131.726562_g1548_i0:28-501(+)